VGLKFSYPAKVERDDAGFYLVTFPDVPEAGTDGRSRDEAISDAPDSLVAALGGYLTAGKALPLPSSPRGNQLLVELSPLIVAKLALYKAMRDSRIRSSTLAKRLGITATTATRLTDLDHRTPIALIERALAELGKRIVTEIHDAA
jgi:antitoxin HicB